jgi:hypothetical protein
MRTLRRLLKARWGKITCLLLGVGLVVGGASYLMGQQRFSATAAHTHGIVVGNSVFTSSSSSRRANSASYCPWCASAPCVTNLSGSSRPNASTPRENWGVGEGALRSR